MEEAPPTRGFFFMSGLDSRLVNRIDPGNLLRLLHRLYVEIDDHGLVVAAHQHAFQRLVAAGVDFLMRHEWGDINEIARTGFRYIFEMIAPAHAGLPTHHIDHAL